MPCPASLTADVFKTHGAAVPFFAGVETWFERLNRHAEERGLARLEDLVESWPDSLPSATFKSDLRRFVKARFDLLPTLAQEISDALSR